MSVVAMRNLGMQKSISKDLAPVYYIGSWATTSPPHTTTRQPASEDGYPGWVQIHWRKSGGAMCFGTSSEFQLS